jgi:hypothetical protein
MARGITKETRSGSFRKFKPVPEKHYGLNIAVLHSVTVTKHIAKEDSKQESFRGLEVPRITFEFREFTKDEPAIFYHSYNALELDRESTTMLEDAMFQMTNHFISAFKHDITDEEYTLLNMTATENSKPSEVLADYNKFFDGVAKIFNEGNNGKAIFKNDKDEPRVIYLKLLMYQLIKGQSSLVNKGDFGIPMFVGEGIVELYRKDIKPNLAINIAKGESIIPREATSSIAKSAKPANSSPVSEDDIPDDLK